MVRARRNPPWAARALRETGAVVRKLASVAVVIALTLRNPADGKVTMKATCYLHRKQFGSAEKSCSRTNPLLDRQEDTGSLPFAYYAHDVISGTELLSIHCLVEVRFGFALEQNHRRR